MEKDSNWHILGVRIWTINVNVCKPLFVWFRNFNPFSFCLLVSLRLVDLVRVTQRRSHQPTSPYPSFFPNFTTLFVCLMANRVNPRRSFTALGLLLSSPPASSPLHYSYISLSVRFQTKSSLVWKKIFKLLTNISKPNPVWFGK